jgi:hypothetical protein
MQDKYPVKSALLFYKLVKKEWKIAKEIVTTSFNENGNLSIWSQYKEKLEFEERTHLNPLVI